MYKSELPQPLDCFVILWFTCTKMGICTRNFQKINVYKYIFFVHILKLRAHHVHKSTTSTQWLKIAVPFEVAILCVL